MTISKGAVRKGGEKTISRSWLTYYNHEDIRWFTRYARSFVCFVALRPKSTAMVIAGRSVHLTTLFPGQA